MKGRDQSMAESHNLHGDVDGDELRVPVDWSSEPLPVFANVVHVAHSEHEFALIFGEIAPFPGRGGGSAHRHADARIVAAEKLYHPPQCAHP